MSAPPWKQAGDRLLLTVRLTPNARDERIDGVQALADGRAILAVRVRAIPEDGAANAALEKLIAKAVGIAKSRANVVSGHTQRIKILELDGDLDDIVARLSAFASAKS